MVSTSGNSGMLFSPIVAEAAKQAGLAATGRRYIIRSWYNTLAAPPREAGQATFPRTTSAQV
jgi:hypothetical protein